MSVFESRKYLIEASLVVSSSHGIISCHYEVKMVEQMKSDVDCSSSGTRKINHSCNRGNDVIKNLFWLLQRMVSCCGCLVQGMRRHSFPKLVEFYPTSLNLPVSSARVVQTVITIRILATTVICMFSHCTAITSNRIGRHGE